MQTLNFDLVSQDLFKFLWTWVFLLMDSGEQFKKSVFNAESSNLFEERVNF